MEVKGKPFSIPFHYLPDGPHKLDDSMLQDGQAVLENDYICLCMYVLTLPKIMERKAIMQFTDSSSKTCVNFQENHFVGRL